MNQTYVDHDVYEQEGSYAYSSIVGGFLHLHHFPPTLEE
jgi:hypothetical protein